MIFTLILYLIIKSVTSEFPCFDNWIYYSVTGKCYKLYEMASTKADANSICRNVFSSTFPDMSNKVEVNIVANNNDAEVLSTILLNLGSNEQFWVNAEWDNVKKMFTYSNGVGISVENANIDSTNKNGSCLSYNYYYSFNQSVPVKYHRFSAVTCSSKFRFICEHNNLQCEKLRIYGFNGLTMQTHPQDIQIELSIKFDCKHGFYRLSNSNNDRIKSIRNCTGTRHVTKDPSKFELKWSSNDFLEECLAVQCTLPLPEISKYSINSTINVASEEKFNYGFKVSVLCAKGYVNHLDTTQTTAELICNQSSTNISQGAWSPVNSSPCTPVKCNLDDLKAQVPVDGSIIQARQKRSLNVTMATEGLKLFPFYDNIVTISCKVGQFFFDRKVEKNLICGLKNMSETLGAWYGYNGDRYPFPTNCIDVTCLYEDVIVRKGMKVESEFEMMIWNGSYIKLTEHIGEPYQRDTKLWFYCIKGFKSATKQSIQNVTCGNRGVWEPQLTACIEETDDIFTGPKKRYVPLPVEADKAKEVGYVAIIILVLFLTLILLLDLSTFTRDVQVMTKNIKNLRRRCKYKNKQIFLEDSQ